MNRTDHRTELIAANQREYGRNYDFLEFPSEAQAEAAKLERGELLGWLQQRTTFGCNGTKVDCSGISPGCQTCVNGAWSCLFINGRCNVACFYCPTSQDETFEPQSNGISFNSPEDYAEYIFRFGFTGASISGGEPLLTLERTISYLEGVRRRCGRSVHLWMYTNGTLLTGEIARMLRDAGLDEIRFDIGATGYDLGKLRLAAGVIQVVTVEIPAVPEDEELLVKLLPELVSAGVHHLNLHQMRLTPHNFRHLASRPYTFLHGEKITVLESELAALRMVRYALDVGVRLPVNYCSFPYKRRFQHAAARRRGIPFVLEQGETVTEAGYIRAVSSGQIRYFEAAILPASAAAPPFHELTLPSGYRIAVKKRPVSPLLSMNTDLCNLTTDGGYIPEELSKYEKIPEGLCNYF